MNIVLDTNVLCALFDENDVHHEAAGHLFHEISGCRIFLPCIVAAELLAGDVPGKKLLELCKNLTDAFLASTERELTVISGFPAALRKKLKANDCLVLAHAIHHHADLFTFDEKLKKAYSKLQASFS